MKTIKAASTHNFIERLVFEEDVPVPKLAREDVLIGTKAVHIAQCHKSSGGSVGPIKSVNEIISGCVKMNGTVVFTGALSENKVQVSLWRLSKHGSYANLIFLLR